MRPLGVSFLNAAVNSLVFCFENCLLLSSTPESHSCIMLLAYSRCLVFVCVYVLINSLENTASVVKVSECHFSFRRILRFNLRCPYTRCASAGFASKLR